MSPDHVTDGDVYILCIEHPKKSNITGIKAPLNLLQTAKQI